MEVPLFIVGKVWPTVSNTQGGPVHNAKQQILAPRGAPIPRLYAAGELGSSFGQLYLSGGNVTECLGPGRVAGRGGRVQHSIRDAEIDMVLRSTLPVRPMIT